MTAVTADRMRDAVLSETLRNRSSGYRQIWTRLKLSHGLTVPRRCVMETLQELHPARSAARRRRRLHRRYYSSPGPNAVWHIDGKSKSCVK